MILRTLFCRKLTCQSCKSYKIGTFTYVSILEKKFSSIFGRAVNRTSENDFLLPFMQIVSGC